MLSATRFTTRPSAPPAGRGGQPRPPPDSYQRPAPRPPRREQDDDEAGNSRPARRIYLPPPDERDDGEAWDSRPARHGYPPDGESWGVGPRRPRERIIGKHESQEEFKFEGQVQAFLEKTHELLDKITTESKNFLSKVDTGKPSRLLEDRELDELSMMRTDMTFQFLGMCVAWQGMYIPRSTKRPENGTVKPAPPASDEPSRRNPIQREDQARERKTDLIIELSRNLDEIIDLGGKDDSLLSELVGQRELRERTISELEYMPRDDPAKIREKEELLESTTQRLAEALRQSIKFKKYRLRSLEGRVLLLKELLRISSSEAGDPASGDGKDDPKMDYDEQITNTERNISAGTASLAQKQRELDKLMSFKAKPAETGDAEISKLEKTLDNVEETADTILENVRHHERPSAELLAEFGAAIHDAGELIAQFKMGEQYPFEESMAGRLRDLQRDHPELYKAWLRASTGAKPTSRHAAYTSPEP